MTNSTFTPPTFGGKSSRTPRVRHEFTFVFTRDDEEVPATFWAIGRTDMLGLARTMEALKRNSTESLSLLLAFVRNMLDDKDGVPLSWEPVVQEAEIPQPTQGDTGPEWPSDTGRLERWFVGPDGQSYPESILTEFTRLEAGSSRRRWAMMVEQDDTLSADIEDLQKLFEWLASLAGKGRTLASR